MLYRYLFHCTVPGLLQAFDSETQRDIGEPMFMDVGDHLTLTAHMEPRVTGTGIVVLEAMTNTWDPAEPFSPWGPGGCGQRNLAS